MHSSFNSSSISESQISALGGKRDKHDESRRVRARNKREIESLEKQIHNKDPKGKTGERLCGCDTMCSVF